MRLFDGGFRVPELSYKIMDFWFALNRTLFRAIEIVNDSITKRLYVVLPDGTILFGDYSQGLDEQSIKWAHWTFQIYITTIELVSLNRVVLGAKIP